MQKPGRRRRMMIHLVQSTWRLPRLVLAALRQWRRRTVLNDREAERLDRIRNPSKYLGKS
jgi:hypothetical protein